MDIQLISQLRKIIDHHAVTQAYLFGSHAHGTVTPLSDIDIAVRYRPGVDKSATEAKLFADVSLLLQTDNIDIIDIDIASPLLAHRAVLAGVPIFEHPAHDEAVLKTRILHQYEDTRHLREIKQAVFI